MTNSDSLTAFIRALSRLQLPQTFNPWKENDPLDVSPTAPADRRERLWAHLSCAKPLAVCLGEAAGYQGLRFSGCAFTSERLICEGAIPRIAWNQGSRITSRARPWSEPSAKIVWETLYKLGIEKHVLLWNAFPLHPHKPDNPLSNRTPTRLELEKTYPILQQFLALFPGLPVVAVGNTAARTLASLEINVATAVRHPAYGGKADFQREMSRFFRML